MTLFGTAGIRGNVSEQVTPSLALQVGQAVGVDADEVVVGRDGRITGSALRSGLVAGLESTGAAVVDVGQVPTPTLAFGSRGRYGIMITASHNPPSDNGLKIFVDGVEADTESEARIEERVEAGPSLSSWDQWTAAETKSLFDGYSNAVTKYVTSKGVTLSGLSVAIDAGNGMAGLVAPSILTSLNVDVTALNANPDGHFPARKSKPTPASLRDFRAFVGDGDFDIGLAFDGDADRIAVVSPEGEIIHEDTILAILAERYVSESSVEDPVIVSTPNASSRVDERVEAAGGRIERCALGALHEGIRQVQSDGSEETEVVFAGEPWKHIHPRFGGWIDGIVSGVVLCRLIAEADGISRLRDPISERPYRKVNVRCSDQWKSSVMDELETEVRAAFPDGTIETEYGIRLERPDGSWVLIRPSGTEDYIRIYVESEDIDDLTQRARTLVEDVVERASNGLNGR